MVDIRIRGEIVDRVRLDGVAKQVIMYW